MGKAAPVTTPRRQLAALKTQTFHVKAKEEKKSVFLRDNLVNTRSAWRGNTCVLPNFWHGAVWRLPEPYLVWCKFNVALTKSRNAPWLMQETAKSVTNKSRREQWKREKVLRWFSSAAAASYRCKVRLEPRPEIAFKVLRIRVKCR